MTAPLVCATRLASLRSRAATTTTTPREDLGQPIGGTRSFDEDLVLFRDVTVKEVMDKQRARKDPTPMTLLREDDTVGAAIAEMNARDVSAVVVQDSRGRLVGLFTER